jgi:nucleotide-binding universal stress UspA family protein
MAAFSTILIATDYSEASHVAVRMAALLARRFGAVLKVLHVLEDSARAYPFPVPPGVRELARDRLLELVGELRNAGLTVNAVFEEGIAAEQIVDSARGTSADLVVLGSHGRSGLPRWVHGSVAEKVVRASPVPVLTVHPADRLPDDPGRIFRKILVPTDFSVASGKGVDLAIQLALELEASLTILHVCELPAPLYVTPDVEREVEAQARRSLAGVLSGARSRVPNAESALSRGSPWAEIVGASSSGTFDVVVLSTHGRRGWARGFLGSVAEKVVRLAPTMVLTVPAPSR